MVVVRKLKCKKRRQMRMSWILFGSPFIINTAGVDLLLVFFFFFFKIQRVLGKQNPVNKANLKEQKTTPK
jgi:hypothetical protein